MTSKPTLRDILLTILFWAFIIAMPFLGSLDAF